MTDTEKKVTANRIVKSCEFITKSWEYDLMFNALVASLNWAESVSTEPKKDTYTHEGE